MTHSKPRERDSFRDFRDTGYLSKNPRDIYAGHCSEKLVEYWISSTDVRGYRVGNMLRETERLGQKLTGYWKSDFPLIGPPKCSLRTPSGKRPLDIFRSTHQHTPGKKSSLSSSGRCQIHSLLEEGGP